MNSVTLTGRLASDPKMSYTTSQTAVCKFRIAVDRISKDKGADFIPITVFGKSAENCEKFLAKGRMVAINGRIQTGSYEKSDGTKVYTTDVIANNVEFLGGGEKKEDQSAMFEAIDADLPF